MTVLGNRIALRRRELKLTQDALAQQLNVTRQTVSSWEVGRTEPDVDTLTALAAALQWEVSDLLGESSPKPVRQLRLIPALPLTLLAVAFSVVCSLVAAWANIQQNTIYDPTPGLVCAFILRPLLWCFWGVTAIHIVAALVPIPLPRRMKTLLPVLGAVCFALFVFLDGSAFFGLLRWDRAYNWFLTDGRILFFLPGLMLGLGIQSPRR